MTLTDWLTVVGICTLGAVSPGPSLAIIIKHTLAGGRAAGTIAALTHGTGVGLYAFICISGLAFVITTSIFWFVTLQWVGAAYLLWLGIKGLTSKPPKDKLATNLTTEDLTISDSTTNDPKITNVSTTNKKQQIFFASETLKNAARDSFLIVFLNPKIAVFFIALFSQFIGPDTSPVVRAIYVTTALAIDAGWYLLVAWLFSIPLWLAKLRQHALWLDRIFGFVLISLAGKLALDLL